MNCARYDIFISYRHASDTFVALLIYKTLKENDYNVFLDQMSLGAEGRSSEIIERVIKEVNKVIIICSPDAMKNMPATIDENTELGMALEIFWARKYNKTIVPLATSLNKVLRHLPSNLFFLSKLNILQISSDDYFGFEKRLLDCHLKTTLYDVIFSLEYFVSLFAVSKKFYEAYLLNEELIKKEEYRLYQVNFGCGKVYDIMPNKSSNIMRYKKNHTCYLNELNLLQKIKIRLLHKSQKEKFYSKNKYWRMYKEQNNVK